MYFVSAPAAACDDLQGFVPDNATKHSPKTDLKLISTTSVSHLRPIENTEISSDILAARILQMHASSDTPEKAACPPPKLIGDTEDPVFEMPGVLQRAERPDRKGPSPRLEPDPVPQPRTAARASAARRTHPGTKTLVAGTAAVVTIAGLAGLWAFGDTPDTGITRTVATQNIVAEPTIEGLIAADVSAGQDPDSTSANGAPTAEQIARAKDRIRNAFHASGRPAHTADDLARPLNNSTAQADDGKIQARLAIPPRVEEQTASPHAGLDSQTLASASGTLPVEPDAPAVASSGAEPATVTVQPPASPSAIQEAPTGEAPTAAAPTDVSGTAAGSGDYPNTGTVTAAVNFRRTGDKDADVLGIIPANTEVSYDTCGSWWCGVIHNGQPGFIGQKYLERSQ